jgi:hypothetical protein
MKFISLIDISSKNAITVDAVSLVLRLEIGSIPKEIRLKKYHAEILYALFHGHPESLGYGEIIDILRMRDLIISDDTRLHRKISEIRNFLAKFHPSLVDIDYKHARSRIRFASAIQKSPGYDNDNGIPGLSIWFNFHEPHKQ